MTEKIIIDATSATIGRIASFATKQALLGKDVVIVNCDSAILSGRKEMILEEYKTARARGSAARKGPHFPKNPERIMKRTIRGMLSYKQGRGSVAFKKIICHNKIPAEYEKLEKISLIRYLKIKTITLKELSELL